MCAGRSHSLDSQPAVSRARARSGIQACAAHALSETVSLLGLEPTFAHILLAYLSPCPPSKHYYSRFSSSLSLNVSSSRCACSPSLSVLTSLSATHAEPPGARTDLARVLSPDRPTRRASHRAVHQRQKIIFVRISPPHPPLPAAPRTETPRDRGTASPGTACSTLPAPRRTPI